MGIQVNLKILPDPVVGYLHLPIKKMSSAKVNNLGNDELNLSETLPPALITLNK